MLVERLQIFPGYRSPRSPLNQTNLENPKANQAAPKALAQITHWADLIQPDAEELRLGQESGCSNS